jgi:hypothetical protein
LNAGLVIRTLLDRAAVAEDDECGVSIQLTTEQALRLAALLQAQPGGGREP